MAASNEIKNSPPQLQPELVEEVFAYLKDRELVQSLDTAKLRSFLQDKWFELVGLTRELADRLFTIETSNATFFLGLAILERYLVRIAPDQEEVRFDWIIPACLWIADKFESEDDHLAPEDVVSIAKISQDNLFVAESQVLGKLNWDVSWVTSYNFVDWFLLSASVAEPSPRTRYATHFLLELGQQSLDFIGYPPSLQAAVAVWFVRKLNQTAQKTSIRKGAMRGPPERVWPQELKLKTSYSPSNAYFKDAVKTLGLFVSSLAQSDNPYGYICERYGTKNFLGVSATIMNYFAGQKLR